MLQGQDRSRTLDRLVLATNGIPSAANLLVRAHERYEAEDYKKAADLFQAAIVANPMLLQDAFFHTVLADVLYKAAHFEEALPACKRLIELRPHDPESYALLGQTLLALHQAPLAVGAFAMTTILDPQNGSAHGLLGMALLETRRFADAEQAFQVAVGLLPNNAAILCNMAGVMLVTGRYTEALSLCEQALAINPKCAPSFVNRALSLHGLGRYEEAVAVGRQALALNPGNWRARYNLAVLLLGMGEMTEEAWAFFETRNVIDGKKPTIFGKPQWLGENLAGKTVLVYADEGLGDMMQFMRYVPLMAKQGARVIVGAHPVLHRLLRDMEGVSMLLAQGEKLQYFDLHCPAGSLPRAFGTTLDSIPPVVPFLPRLLWTSSASAGDPLRVGLVWAGSAELLHNHHRSIALSEFLPLWNVAGVSFVSLQVGAAASESATLPEDCPIEEAMPGGGDYLDTAERVGGLDLVICVDTSIAHLAGTLGITVWMLSRYNGCWRWLHNRSDSPWYPTMTVYRQPCVGDWATPIEAIRSDLAALTAARSRESMA